MISTAPPRSPVNSFWFAISSLIILCPYKEANDIYAMERLTSGLELGLKLDGAEEIRAELKRLKRMKERKKWLLIFYLWLLNNISVNCSTGKMRGAYDFLIVYCYA
ncbi:unnamed protein product [Sphenostylis stenocarpa]|uniref:Uncharacterized protein n=1 Tax=Sphenostylis stenocarpa TaxID=92480 RepID=A0AA86S6G8_9FABA|nr:unnamed protein product [Sphenostylis stenocarpa]